MSRVRAPSSSGQSAAPSGPATELPSQSVGGAGARNPAIAGGGAAGGTRPAAHKRGGGPFNQFNEKWKGPDEVIEERTTFDLQRVSAHGKKLSKEAADRRGRVPDYSQRDPETGKFVSTKDVMDAESPDRKTVLEGDNDAVGRSFESSRPEQATTLAFNSSAGSSSSAGSVSLLGQEEALRMADNRSGTQGNSFDGTSVTNPLPSGDGGPSRGGAGGGNAVG